MWEVQLVQWPDSVRLSDAQIHKMILTTEPDWVRDMTLEKWRRDYALYTYDNDVEAQFEFHKWCEKNILQSRFTWALCAFGNRSQSSDGFFYACGKQENGWYKHIGFRMGLAPSDYASGYMGLNYMEEDQHV
jgi:hypothetical protein